MSVVVHMVKKISTNCLLTKLSLEGTRTSNQADTILCYLLTYIGEVQDVMGLPKWLSGKESACCDRRHSSIPGSGRSPGGGNGNPLQYSHLENSVDRGTCRVVKSQTWLSTHACMLLSGTSYSSLDQSQGPLSWSSHLWSDCLYIYRQRYWEH